MHVMEFRHGGGQVKEGLSLPGTLGFSRKLDNLRAAVAPHVFHYNLCRVHGSPKRTPAVAAGETDWLWK